MKSSTRKIWLTFCVSIVAVLTVILNANQTENNTMKTGHESEEMAKNKLTQPSVSQTTSPTATTNIVPPPEPKQKTVAEKNSDLPPSLVNSLPSGIRYRVIEQGNGTKPDYDDIVHLTSELYVVDSFGEERDRAAETDLTIDLSSLPSLIADAFRQIDEDGTVKFFVPGNMAAFIPEYLLNTVYLEHKDTLIFDVTLNEIETIQ